VNQASKLKYCISYHVHTYTHIVHLSTSTEPRANIYQSINVLEYSTVPVVDKEADDGRKYQGDDCHTELEQLVVLLVTKSVQQQFLTT